jgi:hypothetical protein
MPLVMSQRPPFWLVKAIRLPSGDQAGLQV